MSYNFDDLVIFHGPPFVGILNFYLKELSGTHTRVCPRELLETNPDLGLRELINSFIVRRLLKGEKVTIDDTMQTAAIRRSYVNNVRNKIPGVKCVCVLIRPEFGRDQLTWQQEFSLAERCLVRDRQNVEKTLSIDIDDWFDHCESITDEENLRKIEIALPLQVHSTNPLKMAGLLIECRGEIDTRLISVMERWYRNNRHGRIAAIFALDQNTSEDQDEMVEDFLKNIRMKTDLAVYVYDIRKKVVDLKSATAAIIGFLTRLLDLDLFNCNTVYLYESTKHRKMAESVGVRHLKLERALTNADLLRHGTIQFPAARMLKCVQVLPPSDKNDELTASSLPLFSEAFVSFNCTGMLRLNEWRAVYLVAKDTQILNRYKECYVEAIKGSNSCVTSMKLTDLTTKPNVSGDNDTISKKTKASTERERRPLPKWMSSTKHKSPMKSDVVVARNRDSSRPLPRTVYIMTEDELLKTSIMILKEADMFRPGEETSAMDQLKLFPVSNPKKSFPNRLQNATKQQQQQQRNNKRNMNSADGKAFSRKHFRRARNEKSDETSSEDEDDVYPTSPSHHRQNPAKKSSLSRETNLAASTIAQHSVVISNSNSPRTYSDPKTDLYSDFFSRKDARTGGKKGITSKRTMRLGGDSEDGGRMDFIDSVLDGDVVSSSTFDRSRRRSRCSSPPPTTKKFGDSKKSTNFDVDVAQFMNELFT